MNRHVLYKRTLLLLICLLLLSGCGQERPPLDPSPAIQDQDAGKEDAEGSAGFEGNSKPLDVSPCEGIHVKAECIDHRAGITINIQKAFVKRFF